MFGEYISSGQGTVDTIHLQDGGTVQVSAVDGRSNPHCHCAHARSNGNELILKELEESRDKYLSQLNLVLKGLPALKPEEEDRIRDTFLSHSIKNRQLITSMAQKYESEKSKYKTVALGSIALLGIVSTAMFMGYSSNR